MADEQCAVDFKVIIEGVYHLTLHFIVKIDDDVAAEYNLRLFNTF